MKTITKNKKEVDITEILSFGGGKGGIGKTVITANLANLLSYQGKRVLLADLDLGGSNTHTVLGIEPGDKNLHHFLKREEKDLFPLIFRPPGFSFDFLPGLVNALPEISIPAAQRQKIIRHLMKMKYDYILLDLGAGITPHILDFFNIDRGIVIVIPEPTSVENLYRFIRSAFTRKLMQLKSGPIWKKLLRDILDKPRSFYGKDILVLREKIGEKFPEMVRVVDIAIEKFEPWLIVNMSDEEDDFGEDIPEIASKLLGLKVKLIGRVPYERRIMDDIRRRRLTTRIASDSPFTKALSKIADKILKGEGG